MNEGGLRRRYYPWEITLSSPQQPGLSLTFVPISVNGANARISYGALLGSWDTHELWSPNVCDNAPFFGCHLPSSHSRSNNTCPSFMLIVQRLLSLSSIIVYNHYIPEKGVRGLGIRSVQECSPSGKWYSTRDAHLTPRPLLPRPACVAFKVLPPLQSCPAPAPVSSLVSCSFFTHIVHLTRKDPVPNPFTLPWPISSEPHFNCTHGGTYFIITHFSDEGNAG